MTSPTPTTEPALEQLLSEPDEPTVETLTTLDGDVILLGAGGKMGPSLARMARRAIADRARRVIAVSRFRDAAVSAALEADGITVVRADLADPHAVAALPWAANVLWLAGQKFGTTGDPVGTWTENVVASVHAAERFARDGARIVCFSTGNVYGRTPVAAGGSREHDALAPDGEYAASCIGRERVFESVARRTGAALLCYRLFYANDLRYGVVTEIARKVLVGEPIDVTTGHVNVIWQGDANRLALRALSLASAPGQSLNVTGPIVSVREIATACAEAAETTVKFVGTESDTALLANTSMLSAALPHTPLGLRALCAMSVLWLRAGGRTLAKPTKFEVRDGKF